MAGQNAAQAAGNTPDEFRPVPLVSNWPPGGPRDDELDLTDLRNSLGSEMWRDVGIQRSQRGLEGAQKQVDFWSTYVAAKEFSDPRGWELQNMLLVSRLIIAGALRRQESRGTHLRTDFPQPDPKQARHFSVLAGPGEPSAPPRQPSE